MTIYIESVLAINFGANLALLWMSGRGLGLRSARWRLAAGAGFGALYALACIGTASSVLSTLPVKLAAAGLMLALAYAPQSISGWLRLGAVFALASTSAAGFTMVAAMGGGYPASVGNVLIAGRQAAASLPIGLALAGVAASLVGRALANRGAAVKHCRRATIVVDEASVELDVLVDTGNRLRDPVSGSPVLVAEYSAVAALLPPGWRRLMATGPAVASFGELAACDDDWARRLRLVPYRGLGASGALLGFSADCVRLPAEQGWPPATAERVVVAVSPERLSMDGGFTGILPADLAEAYDRAEARGI